MLSLLIVLLILYLLTAVPTDDAAVWLSMLAFIRVVHVVGLSATASALGSELMYCSFTRKYNASHPTQHAVQFLWERRTSSHPNKTLSQDKHISYDITVAAQWGFQDFLWTSARHVCFENVARILSDSRWASRSGRGHISWFKPQASPVASICAGSHAVACITYPRGSIATLPAPVANRFRLISLVVPRIPSGRSVLCQNFQIAGLGVEAGSDIALHTVQ